jgi:hypothetical protein
MLDNASSSLVPLAVVFSSASVSSIASSTLSAIISSSSSPISVSSLSSCSSSPCALLSASLSNASYASRCLRVNRYFRLFHTCSPCVQAKNIKICCHGRTCSLPCRSGLCPTRARAPPNNMLTTTKMRLLRQQYKLLSRDFFWLLLCRGVQISCTI